MDCHCVCTATAAVSREEGQEIDPELPIAYATRTLRIEYLRPTPIDKPVRLWAEVKEMTERKAIVTYSLFSSGLECARGEAVAVRVRAEGLNEEPMDSAPAQRTGFPDKNDDIVKSHELDGTVKSPRCKARETGDPPAGWGVQAKHGQTLGMSLIVRRSD